MLAVIKQWVFSVVVYYTFDLLKRKVKRHLKRLNKAASPDSVSPWVSKASAEQLCGTLQHLFDNSLIQEKVPVLWKTFCLIPVPNISDLFALATTGQFLEHPT